MKFSEMPYTRPDFEGLKSDYLQLTEQMKFAVTIDSAIEAVEHMNKLEKHISTLAELVTIRHTIDTRDLFYEAEQNVFDEQMPELESRRVEFKKALLESPFKERLSEKYGKQLFDLAEIEVRSFDDSLVTYMVEENKLTSAYQKLVASADIEFDGEHYNLSGLETLMQAADREIRKRAYHEYAGFFAAHEKEFDEIYDKLVKIRNAKAKALGMENFIPLAYLLMGRQGYGPEDVFSFRKQVEKEIVPVCVELRKKQAERIKVEKLKFYDENFHFNDGNALPIGNEKQMVECAGEMYDELSAETGEFFRFMRSNELMDLETKQGKAAGGYCTMIPDYESPFIFSNFNGTSDDVGVLTHEAGHAFQAYTTNKRHQLADYSFPSSESAEIHSMSMEFLTYPWMDKFFGDQAEKYKFLHTSDALTFVPYGACVDEFQHRVYEKPEMTPDERKAVWHELEKKYLPNRDYDGEEIFERGGFYFQKLHIFMYPFYYIDYCLASMASFEFYGKMKTDRHEAWKDYYAICEIGGSKPYLEILKAGNLSNPFEEGNVKRSVQILLKSVMNE